MSWWPFAKEKPAHDEAPQATLSPDLDYSATEQAIIDRFERMPRVYRRIIERQKPKGWSDLVSKMDDVEERFGKKP